jgi:uncharacterized RDD family membrane protein YckC
MMPRPTPARVSVPVATAMNPLAPSQLQSRVQTQALPQAQVQLQQAQPQPEPQALPQAQFGIIYLIKRIFAYLFDSIINISLCVAAFILAMLRLNLNPDSLLNPNIVLLPVIFLFVFNWALITAQEVAFGTSLGKRVFGLALNGSAAVTFLRAFFFIPSLGFCGVGLLWALFDRKKRCWHDVAADLQPIEIAQL